MVAALIRLWKRAPPAVATDLFGYPTVFDFVVISDRDPFLRFVNSISAENGLMASVAFAAFLGITLWSRRRRTGGWGVRLLHVHHHPPLSWFM
jgi:hypothetical protein